MPKKTTGADPIDVEVGARIRLRRRALKMTQADLAGELGISFQQIQKYEKGANRVGASRLRTMAGVLQAPESFFFDGVLSPGMRISDWQASLPAELAAFISSADGLALNQAFLKINKPGLRRSIVTMITAIAANGDGEAVRGDLG